MKKTLISLAIVLAIILGFTTAVNASYISFYDENGGTKIGYMEHVHDDDITVLDPTREGYDFAGWASDDTNVTITGNHITLPWGSGDPRNNNPLDVYATWTLSQYDINYQLNGGSVTGNPDTYTIEDSDITLNNPTKAGYEFVGWTDVSGADLGTTVTIPQGSTGDKTFIAVWNPIVYTISYILDGGSVADNPDTYTADDTFTLNNPTKEGYNFVGWTDENGTDLGTTVTIPQGSIGDKIFTANWEAVPEVTVEEKTTMNPPTADNVAVYVAMLATGLVGVIASIKLKKD